MKPYLLIFILSCSLLRGSLEELWHQARIVYTQINTSLAQQNLIAADIEGCYSDWLELRKKIGDYIIGPVQKDFLNTLVFHQTMLRIGMGEIQKFELEYLKTNVSQKTLHLLKKFRESSIHAIKRECEDFACTANSLGQLFYAARIFDTVENPTDLKTITEFGGGFGNLAHIFCSLLPETTYIIFDVPEMLALQYLYLKGSIPDRSINVILNQTQEIEHNAINLIPSVFCRNMNFSTDLFISTFAISETSKIMQATIINKKFYNAQLCYITGQLYNETNKQWVHHEGIQSAVKFLFTNYNCQPFHAPPKVKSTYELIASNN
jgi:putative sugar O-methyltransferase